MSLFGIGGTKSGDANDYINNRLSIRQENFFGTLAQLNELISRETDECAQYVKDDGVLRSLNGARQACSDAINQHYAPAVARLQGQSFAQDQQVTGLFLSGNNSIFMLVVVAAIILLLIIL